MSHTKTRKLKIVRTSTQPPRLEEGEAVHVGVDVGDRAKPGAMQRPPQLAQDRPSDQDTNARRCAAGRR